MLGHLIRADAETDHTETITIHEQGYRVSSYMLADNSDDNVNEHNHDDNDTTTTTTTTSNNDNSNNTPNHICIAAQAPAASTWPTAETGKTEAEMAYYYYYYQ